MTAQPRSPVARAVGHLAELPRLERRIVRCIRLWSGGPEGRERLGREFVTWAGGAAPRLAVVLDDLLKTTVRHARRPLMAHALDCPCAGADECIFARFALRRGGA